MKIWLINHYAVPPQYYPLARPSLFAKNLIAMGHEVTIIAASTVHNSDQNLIEGREKIKKETVDGIPYVYVKCSTYKGNGIGRVINILEYAAKLPSVCDTLDKPDVIVSTSFDPISCYQGIRYAKKHKIAAVAEIADLWPETMVAYGWAKASNPLVKALRILEKKIYMRADAIVFTAEGEYEYIVEQGWQNEIPRDKVTYINNGIDLELFDYNKDHFIISDEDLDNEELFKVVYTGSIRQVNNLGLVLDAAKEIRNPAIKILIWGAGDQAESLKRRVIDEGIHNVCFKGKVDKKYVPYITSKSGITFAHNSPNPSFKYGLSFNKIFDYMAAGRPILCDFPANYNPVLQSGAGVSVDSADPKDIARQIEAFAVMSEDEIRPYCIAARKAAQEYDFKNLTQKLLDTINKAME